MTSEEYSPFLDNFRYNVGRVAKKFGGTAKKAGKFVGDSIKARQKRKQTDASARLVAAKGLAAPSPKIQANKQPKEKSKGTNTALLIGGGVVAVALVIVVIVVMKKKK